MSARINHKRRVLQKRVHTLEADLASLQPDQYAYSSKKQLLAQQLQLAKAELRPLTRKAGRKAASKAAVKQQPAPKAKKKSPLPGGASFPSFQLPNPKSPTFYEDSLKTVGSLRNLCKQAMTYIQRADQLFDGLHGVGSQLQQTGVLPKILSGKFRDLNTSEWGALLMALMQSPLSGMLLGGGGGAGPEQPALPEGEASAAAHTESRTDAHSASHS